MFVLNLWLITTLIAIVCIALAYIEFYFEIKTRKLKSTRKKSRGERIWGWVKMLISCCIPLYNIIVIFAMLMALFSQETKDKSIQSLIDKGELVIGDS